MNRKNENTLKKIFSHPTSGNVRWSDVEAMLREIGAEITERESSRVSICLSGSIRVFHRPHPGPDMDKGAVANLKK